MWSLSLFIAAASASSIPADPQNFTQLRDHFSLTDFGTWQQRYYKNDTAFGGAGHPIICILGGEGGIAPSTGIFYPPVVILAQRLRAAIVEPEHRFYGASRASLFLPRPFAFHCCVHGLIRFTPPHRSPLGPLRHGPPRAAHPAAGAGGRGRLHHRHAQGAQLHGRARLGPPLPGHHRGRLLPGLAVRHDAAALPRGGGHGLGRERPHEHAHSLWRW